MSLLTEQIKKVDVHLSTVLGSSVVLRNEIAQLIDFELVVQPLNAIYERMVTNKIMEPFGFEITAETTRQINTNLQKLAEKMPKMPFNELLEADFDESTTIPSAVDSAEDSFNHDADESTTNPSALDSSEESFDPDADESTITPSVLDSSEESFDHDADESTTTHSVLDSSEESFDHDADESTTTPSVVDSEELHRDGSIGREVIDFRTGDSEEVFSGGISGGLSYDDSWK